MHHIFYAFHLQVPVDVTTLGYWPQIVITAVQKGFCGALSTVSTLVNEVRPLIKRTITE